jgi:hypothetical protein
MLTLAAFALTACRPAVSPSLGAVPSVDPERALVAAGLQMLSVRWLDAAPVCLAIRTADGQLGDPDPSFVAELNGQRRVLPYSRCAPSDAAHRVILGRVLKDAEGDATWALEHQRRGSAGLYACEAVATSDEPPVVTCHLRRMIGV